MNRNKKKPIAFSLCLIVGLAIGAYFFYSFLAKGGQTGPALPIGRFNQMALTFADTTRNAAEEFRHTDSSRIDALVQILNTAEPDEPHKCATVATLVLQSESGETEKLELLPGHGDGMAGFRGSSGYFRISKAELAAALESVGAKGIEPFLKP